MKEIFINDLQIGDVFILEHGGPDLAVVVGDPEMIPRRFSRMGGIGMNILYRDKIWNFTADVTNRAKVKVF